eukprot:5567227-Lingulodinium_polyedra.AAC.1
MSGSKAAGRYGAPMRATDNWRLSQYSLAFGYPIREVRDPALLCGVGRAQAAHRPLVEHVQGIEDQLLGDGP